MSIIAFTGLPGHGKSYGVVAHVLLPNLEKGRTICTNIPLNHEQIKADFPKADIRVIEKIDHFSDGTLTFEHDVPPGAVCIFDEIWRIWPAGIKANEASHDHKTFLAEHRHLVGPDGKTTEIVLVTQDLAQISNFARQLVEKTFITHKLNALGSKTKYRVDTYHGMVVGQRGGKSSFAGSSFGQYSESVWKYYVSHTKSEGVVGIEAEADKRGSVWARPYIYIGFPLSIAFLVYGATSLYSRFTSDDSDQLVQQASATREVRTESGRATQRASEGPSKSAASEQRQETLREIVYDLWQGEADLELSERWRIGATLARSDTMIDENLHETMTVEAWREYASKFDRGYVVITDDEYSITLNLQACTRLKHSIQEWECVYEGERITTFSGTRKGSGVLATALGD
jgi:zona occludens toxin